MTDDKDNNGSNSQGFDYDFLVEDKHDCLTWKFYDIPISQGGCVKINKSANHRLVWLSRSEYNLSHGRGFVKRVDFGTYTKISYELAPYEFKLVLSGNLLCGLMTIRDKFCQLKKDI